MNRLVLSATMWGTVVLCASTTWGDDKEDQRHVRHDLCAIKLSDGSELWMFAREFYPGKPHSSRVVIGCSDEANQLMWSTPFASLDHVPGKACYYALAKITDDRIFLFFTWGGQYCTIDRRTGKLLGKGNGDDVLRTHESLVPLKLTTIKGRSTGYDMSR